MSYASSWGDGFDFKDLGSMIGLHGLKPMKYHIESSIGLHGWNGLGKAQGTNALAGALLAGGMYAAPYLGAGGSSAGAAPGGATAGTGGGMFSGLFGGGGGFASAASAATPTTSATTPTSADGGLLSGFSKYAEPISKGMQIGQQTQGLLSSQQQPIQQPALQHQQPEFASLLSQDQTQQDAERRRQQQQMVMQGLLGGYRG